MTLSELDGADKAVPGWCMDGRDEVLVVPGSIIAPSGLIIGDNTSGL